MTRRPSAPPSIPFWRDREKIAIIWQAVFALSVAAVFAWLLHNAFDNLRTRGVAAGFGFLWVQSSLSISETPSLPVLHGGALAAPAVFVASAVLLAVLSRLRPALLPRLLGEAGATRLALVLLFVVPAALLYLNRDEVSTFTYSAPGLYGLALLTALLNTVKVAAVAIVLSLFGGLLVGLCRLSPNWLVARIALAYVELMRNVPLLLHIFFWYFGVLRTLPNVRNSVKLGDWLVLNNRGVIMPQPVGTAATQAWFGLLLLVVVLIAGWVRYARRHQLRTGRALPMVLPSLAVALAAGLIGSQVGAPLQMLRPELHGFNYIGGITVTPEYAALLVALVLYCAAFLGEIVRSAIRSVPLGQSEAGRSLGLTRRQLLWLVILPQAQRVAIPPALATCLGLIKDTSLGVTIGYPELVAVSGTILDVSGQVLEIILLIVLFYMTLTLGFSALMNWYNARIRVPGT